MYRFFATFPAGCYEVVARRLKSFPIGELRIIEHDHSSVTCVTQLSIEKLIELRFFTNVYVVLESAVPVPTGVIKAGTFELRALENGKPVALLDAERRKIAEYIHQTFGLSLNAGQARNRFYMLRREAGRPFLAIRLPRAKFKRRKLAAGELRPELAHILCLAAGLKAKHTVLDPFAGYGGIVREITEGFGCRKVIAVDTHTLPDVSLSSRLTWQRADSRHLDFIRQGEIDRVITDPPWGAHDTSIQLPDLYQNFSSELARVLRPDGIAVILSGYASTERILGQTTGLKLLHAWPILVSGKKATIYKLQKLAHIERAGSTSSV